jgi:ABC-type phosphate transport system substrate-binding protein
LGFAFNVRDLRTGQRILDLKLTPNLLAEIFTGQIRSWNDPRIAALNPDYTLPTKLRVVGRADRSAANLLLTSYFWENAKDAYLAGGPAFAAGPTDTYPSVLSIDLRTYGPAVAEQLARPSENDPRIDPTYGFIGVLDTSMAAVYGLPVAAVGETGTGFVSPDQDAMRAALPGMQEQPDGTLVPDVSPDAAGAYPMTTVSYALLPTEDISSDLSRALTEFVQYGVTDGQEGLPAGYLPLTDELVEQATDAAAALPGGPPAGPVPGSDPDGSGGPVPEGVGGGGPLPGVGGLGGLDASGVGGPGSPADGVRDGDATDGVVEVSYLFGPAGLLGSPASWVLLPLLGVGAAVSMVVGGRMMRADA